MGESVRWFWRSVKTAAASDPVIARRVAEAGVLLADPLRRDARRVAGSAGKLAEWACGEVLLAADDATVRAAALWVHHRVCAEGEGTPWHLRQLCSLLARRKLGWTTEEAEWAFRVLRAGMRDSHDVTFPMPFAVAKSLPPAGREAVRPHLEWALEELTRDDRMDRADRPRWLPRLQALLADAAPAGPGLAAVDPPRG